MSRFAALVVVAVSFSGCTVPSTTPPPLDDLHRSARIGDVDGDLAVLLETVGSRRGGNGDQFFVRVFNLTTLQGKRMPFAGAGALPGLSDGIVGWTERSASGTAARLYHPSGTAETVALPGEGLLMAWNRTALVAAAKTPDRLTLYVAHRTDDTLGPLEELVALPFSAGRAISPAVEIDHGRVAWAEPALVPGPGLVRILDLDRARMDLEHPSNRTNKVVVDQGTVVWRDSVGTSTEELFMSSTTSGSTVVLVTPTALGGQVSQEYWDVDIGRILWAGTGGSFTLVGGERRPVRIGVGEAAWAGDDILYIDSTNTGRTGGPDEVFAFDLAPFLVDPKTGQFRPIPWE